MSILGAQRNEDEEERGRVVEATNLSASALLQSFELTDIPFVPLCDASSTLVSEAGRQTIGSTPLGENVNPWSGSPVYPGQSLSTGSWKTAIASTPPSLPPQHLNVTKDDPSQTTKMFQPPSPLSVALPKPPMDNEGLPPLDVSGSDVPPEEFTSPPTCSAKCTRKCTRVAGGCLWEAKYIPLVSGPLYVKFAATYALCHCTLDSQALYIVPRDTSYPQLEFSLSQFQDVKLLDPRHYHDTFMCEVVMEGVPLSSNVPPHVGEHSEQQYSARVCRDWKALPELRDLKTQIPRHDHDSVVSQGHQGGQGFTVLTLKALSASELCDWTEAFAEISTASKGSYDELSQSAHSPRRAAAAAGHGVSSPSTDLSTSSRSTIPTYLSNSTGSNYSFSVPAFKKPIEHEERPCAKVVLPVYGRGYYKLC